MSYFPGVLSKVQLKMSAESDDDMDRCSDWCRIKFIRRIIGQCWYDEQLRC